MAKITKEHKRENIRKVFEAVKGSKLGVTTSEVALEANFPVKTTYNYLHKLESKDIVYRDGKYWFWDYGY